MSEQELILKIIESDESAFKELVNLFQGKVVKTCFNFLHNSEDAEDTAQEVFIEIFYSISKFKQNSTLSTWIYKIAVNKSIDLIRKKKRKKRFADFVNIFKLDISNDENLLVVGDTPDKIVENKEKYVVLIKSLDMLSENQKIALTLSKIEDLSNKEIADIMGSSVSAVESLIHRAKNNLKNILSKSEWFGNNERQKYYKKELE